MIGSILALIFVGIPCFIYLAVYFYPGGRNWLSKHGLYY